MNAEPLVAKSGPVCVVVGDAGVSGRRRVDQALFHISGTSSYIGLALLPGGSVSTFANQPLPIGAEAQLAGSANWEQTGNAFTLTHVVGDKVQTCEGTLQGSRFVSGKVTISSSPNEPLAFTAAKAPSEMLSPM